MRHTLIGYVFTFSALILSGCAHNAPVLEEPANPSGETKTPQPQEKPLEFLELSQGVWLHTGYKVVPSHGKPAGRGILENTVKITKPKSS